MTTVVLQGSTTTLLAVFAEYPGGPATDITGATIAIEAANGTTVLAATSTGVTNPDTGIYTYTWAVPADQAPGNYIVTWTGTASGTPVEASEVVLIAAVPTYSAQLAAARRYDRVPYPATDAAGNPIPGAHGTLWDGPAGGAGANQVTNITTLDGAPIPGGVLVADGRGFFPGFYDLNKTPNLYIIGSDTGVIEGVDPVLIEPSDTDDRVIAIEAYVTGPGGLSERIDDVEASRGQPLGIATLGADGRVQPAQLPGELGGSLGYSVTDYGAIGDGTTDDAAAIQSVLNLVASTAPGARIVFPPGTYLVMSELEIQSAVHLDLMNGATIKRGSASMQYILRNFNASYAPTLYGGRGNIRITGGTIDADGGNLTGSVTSVIFAHAKNVLVEDVTFRNVRDWHAIEFNSTQDGAAVGCIFEGFNPVAAGRTISEAIQIDLAKDSSVLPGIGSGAYDNTPCDNIRIDGCTVRGRGSLGSFGRLVGSHSFTDGVFHTKIRIVDCHATGLNDFMIRGYNWLDTVIDGLTASDSNGGIRYEVPTGSTGSSESLTVGQCDFRNMGVQNNGTAVLGAVISIAGLTSPSVPDREVILSGVIIKTFANATGVEIVNVADAIINGVVIKTGSNGSSVGLDVAGCQNATVGLVKVDGVVTGIKVRDATVSGVGVGVSGCVINNCTGAGIQVDTAATSIAACRVKASGSASKASVELNASQCLLISSYIWKTGGSGVIGVTVTASSTDSFIAGNFLRGWGTTQAASITDNGTTTTISSTEKFISTA